MKFFYVHMVATNPEEPWVAECQLKIRRAIIRAENTRRKRGGYTSDKGSGRTNIEVFFKDLGNLPNDGVKGTFPNSKNHEWKDGKGQNAFNCGNQGQETVPGGAKVGEKQGRGEEREAVDSQSH